MILAEESGSAWRKACHIVCSFTVNPTCTGLGSNPFLRREGPEIIGLSHGTTYGLARFGFVPQDVYVYCFRIRLGEKTQTLHQPFVNVDIVTEKWVSNNMEILSDFVNLSEKCTRGRGKYAAKFSIP
jgi:hypothetical protein